MSETIVRQLMSKCFDSKAIKFGDFVLKTGIHSPLYVDIRAVALDPNTQEVLSDLFIEKILSSNVSFDLICGVPYTALPIASSICIRNRTPMVMKRKESKDYGTKQMIEGNYRIGDKVLIIEDIISSGSSILETALTLRSVGLVVTDALVFIDRQQNGIQNMKEFNINVQSLIDVKTALGFLRDDQKISSDEMKRTLDWINSNPLKVNEDILNEYQLLSIDNKTTKLLSYEERSELTTHSLSKQLFQLMTKKRSNLCVAADLTDWQQILELAKKVGPFIVILKLHIDIVDNFENQFIEELTQIARELQFFIFEDRKFSDIGHTVSLQYNEGVYRISSWADIVTAHLTSGPAVIEGLKADIPKDSERGCLLVASMSSKGSLTNKSYAQTAHKWAKQHKDFVIGFISQSRVSSDQSFIHMTPGVRLDVGADSLGQQYVTPEEAVGKRGADVIIVGRGITSAVDPQLSAQLYRSKGFEAYLNRL